MQKTRQAIKTRVIKRGEMLNANIPFASWIVARMPICASAFIATGPSVLRAVPARARRARPHPPRRRAARRTRGGRMAGRPWPAAWRRARGRYRGRAGSGFCREDCGRIARHARRRPDVTRWVAAPKQSDLAPLPARRDGRRTAHHADAALRTGNFQPGRTK